jgi:hypothetical protein
MLGNVCVLVCPCNLCNRRNLRIIAGNLKIAMLESHHFPYSEFSNAISTNELGQVIRSNYNLGGDFPRGFTSDCINGFIY